MPFGNGKKYFRGSFQFSILKILKIYHSGNLKFINLVIFQSFEFRISMEKNPNFSYAKFYLKYFRLLWVNLSLVSSLSASLLYSCIRLVDSSRKHEVENSVFHYRVENFIPKSR